MLQAKLHDVLTILKMPAILEHYQSLAGSAANNHNSYSEYLLQLLEYELTNRDQRAKQTVLKMAPLPIIKTIQGFSFKDSSIDKTLINQLLTLSFIDKIKNILLLGPSGVSKTHIAIALGYAATQKRIKTKFITISDLMLQLEGSKHNATLDNYLKRVIYSPRLLIIDEFGYIKLGEIQANWLLQIINKNMKQAQLL